MIHFDEPRQTPAHRMAALGLLACLLLAACGKQGPTGNAATQVAAKVNKDEISIHQVQQALQRQPRLAAAQPLTAAKRVLDALVEQELAAQAARADGLETDPGVVQALEAAKREVLARAYQERLAARAVAASTDEVDRYYDSRPALFSERRLYTLQEFAMEASSDDLARIQAAVAKARSVEEISESLRKAGLRFRTRQLALAAEDLPTDVLESVAKLGVGQSTLLQQPGSGRVYTVLHAEVAPLERNAAKGAIEAFLIAERKRELVTQEMKALRDRATIVYQGSFAQAASAPASAAASAAN